MNVATPVPASQAPVPPAGLNPKNLNVAKEGTYFVWVTVFSIIIWAALAISIIGLFYGVIIGILLWLGNGLLTAHLRAEAIRVGPQQLPELDATFREVCSRLGMARPPGLYVLQSGGLLNAFATQFAGRDFVVVYSDFLEALGPSSPEMRFILGHEIGHIQSRHILKHIFLAPGLACPLIGPAYRRAWETSCDRYGAFAAQDVDAAVRAMLVLGGGREHGRRLNAVAFADQYAAERGFFVSLHELTSSYPTLSRRVVDLEALKEGRRVPRQPRSPLAYFVGLLMPGGELAKGGPAGAMMMVVMIGLLAAMAIPAFQKVRETSQAKVCVNNQRMLAAALDQYRLENGSGAKTWEDVVGPTKIIKAMPVCLKGGTYNAQYDSKAESYLVECSVPAHNHVAPGTSP